MVPMCTNTDAIALRYLRYLAVREGGYVRRGVPGWALREDVERATRLHLPERLPRMHARGLLDREDVRAPRLSRPTSIYRVTQAGADRVASEADLPRLRFLPPLRPAARETDVAIHVPRGAARALGELRRAMEKRMRSPHLPGESGWRTLGELRAQLGDADPAEPPVEPWTPAGLPWEEAGDEASGGGWDPLRGGAPLAAAQPPPGTDDLAWLVRTGLAQRWTTRPPPARGVTLYRITPLGGVAILLEWREPQ